MTDSTTPAGEAVSRCGKCEDGTVLLPRMGDEVMVLRRLPCPQCAALTPPPPPPAPDVEAEYAAFCVWATNWFPHSGPPSASSHVFDAWMASARHLRALTPPTAIAAVVASAVGIAA